MLILPMETDEFVSVFAFFYSHRLCIKTDDVILYLMITMFFPDMLQFPD